MKNEVKFLGHTFNQIKAEINEETRKAVKQFKEPKSKRTLQSFLGLVNWDRRFIKNMAQLTKPLEKLLKKNEKFVWGEEQKKAFDKIKRAFDEAPELFLIHPKYKFGIDVDAAHNGLGARLFQYDDEEKKEFTLAYASRSLKGAEKNYHITDLECLAMVWALRKWYTLLIGRQVRVNTDHQALKYLSTCVNNSGRIARWWFFLQEFDLEIRYIKGKDNIVADKLSRNNETKIELIENINEGINTSEWIPIIRRAQLSDEILWEDMIEFPDKIKERDGLIRIQTPEGDKIALPRNITWIIIKKIHELLLHFGSDKVLHFLNKHFFGFNFARIVRDVVASCNVCQATKYYTRPAVGDQYYELPNGPMQLLSMDLFGPLPKSNQGSKYILVIMDVFSKFIKLYPMPDQKLESITRKLEEFLEIMGTPEVILTDNGGQFITDRWKQFARERNFMIRHTSPYNPQSNPVERVMKELGRIIRTYASHRQTRWEQIIERTEKVMNYTAHTSTGYTPQELQYRQPQEINIDPLILPVQQNQERWETKIANAKSKMVTAAGKRKQQFNKHDKAKEFTVGQLV